MDEREKLLAGQKNRRLALWLSAIAISMFGFGYALVPLYNVLCKQLGINSQTVRQEISPLAPADDTALPGRSVILQFTTNNNAELPWDFKALQTEIKVHLGKNYQVKFYAKNNTQHTMTVQAIPSITPGIAGKYLKKTECFCFRQQTLKAGEEIYMPVVFHFDKALPDNIRMVTLGYTLFQR